MTQSEQHATPNFGVVISSPTLGTEITYKTKQKERKKLELEKEAIPDLEPEKYQMGLEHLHMGLQWG